LCPGDELPEAPNRREAYWPPEVGRPFRLLPHPGLVDEPFVQFPKRPTHGMSRLHVVAQEVDVTADRDRLAWRPGEVGGHARHQKIGVKADEYEATPTLGDACHLPVKWPKVGQVLVRERLGAEIVGRGGEPGVRYVRDAEGSVEAPTPRAFEHFGGDVDPIHSRGAVTLEPCPDPSCAARQVEYTPRSRPIDRLQPVQQAKVHLVLNGLLVRTDPLGVPFRHLDDRIPTLVEDGVIHGCPSHTPDRRPPRRRTRSSATGAPSEACRRAGAGWRAGM